MASGNINLSMFVSLSLRKSIQPPYNLLFLHSIHQGQMTKKKTKNERNTNNSLIFKLYLESFASRWGFSVKYICRMGIASCQLPLMCVCVYINAAVSHSKVYTYRWKQFSHSKGKLDSLHGGWYGTGKVIFSWLPQTDSLVVARCNRPVNEWWNK